MEVYIAPDEVGASSRPKALQNNGFKAKSFGNKGSNRLGGAPTKPGKQPLARRALGDISNGSMNESNKPGIAKGKEKSRKALSNISNKTPFKIREAVTKKSTKQGLASAVKSKVKTPSAKFVIPTDIEEIEVSTRQPLAPVEFDGNVDLSFLRKSKTVPVRKSGDVKQEPSELNSLCLAPLDKVIEPKTSICNEVDDDDWVLRSLGLNDMQISNPPEQQADSIVETCWDQEIAMAFDLDDDPWG